MQLHRTRVQMGLPHRIRIDLVAAAICLGVVFASTISDAAVFTCSGGDVDCLVAAMNTANANGQANTIRLAPGVYTLRAVNNFTGTLPFGGPNGLPYVTSTLTITGAGAATIERAADAPLFRIFHVDATATLTLSGMTIRGGRTGVSGSGGAVAGGNVVVARSAITGNQAGVGGGLYIGESGNLTIRHSTVAQNFDGGGIWFHSQGMLTVADSEISRNSTIGLVGGGGGILIGGNPSGQSGGIVTIANSTISDNDTASSGAIAIQSASTVTIDHSSIVDNIGRSTPGIAAVYGTLNIHDSTIARNTGVGGCGGGLSVSSSVTATVTASTIVDNRSLCGSGNGVLGSARLENTILARNLPLQGVTYVGESNCSSPFTSLGHNLIGAPTGCVDLQPTDVVGDAGLAAFIDPGRPGTGHYPLLAGSLAIDVGSDEACSRRDQQGLVRPIDGDGDDVRRCDIGASEFYPVVNEWVRLDYGHATFVPPDSTQTALNPLATGGTYRIDAVFTNSGGEHICHVAFEVVTLDVTSGVASVLTRAGALIGREGTVVPAPLVSGGDNLRAGDHDRYRFTIGVSEPVPLTFFVNVLGERTLGRCSRREAPRDEPPAAFPPPD